MVDIGHMEHFTFQDGVTATANGESMDTGGASGVWVQIAGMNTAIVTFEATIDDTNWVAILARNTATGSAATTAIADGIFFVQFGGDKLRCRISAYTGGTITVLGRGITNEGLAP